MDERDELLTTPPEAIWSCKVGVADRAALPGGADSPLRDVVERAYRELTGRDPDFLFSGWGAQLDKEEREAVRKSAQTLREVAASESPTPPPDGWQGTPPAEGTRRKLIRDSIAEAVTEHFSPHGGTIESRDSFSLKLADAVESALLQSTIDERAMARGADPEGEGDAAPPAGTKELHVVLAPNPDADSPQMLFVEVEDQDGRALRFPRLRDDDDDLTRIVIPYERDDSWVASLAHRIAGAVVAGEPSGVACRRLLEEAGVRSLCERHAEEELAKGVRSTEPPTRDNHIDEFTLVLLACERLHDRLTDGPVPNPAELARVIDILR